ncbi:MAG: hypothetical protein AB1777_12695, partial [Bacteroidota bacterium]
LVYMYDTTIQYILNWVDMYDYNHTIFKLIKFLQIIKAAFNFYLQFLLSCTGIYRLAKFVN